MACSLEKVNELSVSITGGEFLDKLIGCQLVKDCAAWNLAIFYEEA
jgi:hypothetical protein